MVGVAHSMLSMFLSSLDVGASIFDICRRSLIYFWEKSECCSLLCISTEEIHQAFVMISYVNDAREHEVRVNVVAAWVIR